LLQVDALKKITLEGFELSKHGRVFLPTPNPTCTDQHTTIGLCF